MPTDPTPDPAGPRAVLRVPEILLAVAARGRAGLAELCLALEVPKTSLYRLLRTLEGGGYLDHRDGAYSLGPASFALARTIEAATPASACRGSARPVLEWLARETGETVMLAVLTEEGDEVVYVDVIDSAAPVRFTVPVGDRRPLYSAASGKAALAFMSEGQREKYLATCGFEPFTPQTASREEIGVQLQEAERAAVAMDDGGKIVGAAGLASPIFGADGRVFASISVAGPTDRLISARSGNARKVREAGERISRLAGFVGTYPPRQ